MIVSRRLAWVVLLGAILTAGILRQFHTKIPTSPFLPTPIGSLLFFFILILFLVFARGWGRRQEVPYAGAGLTRVNFLAIVPLLLALMLEKWISITFYGPLFYRINSSSLTEERFDALFLIETAIGLMIVSLLLLPLFVRLLPLLRKYLSPERIPLAALWLGIALASLYGSLALFFFLAGTEGVHLRWGGFGEASGLVLTGQALIAIAEEFYYRGLLQTETAFLLPALGLAKERLRLGGAIVLISLAFALEHFAISGVMAQDLRRFTFTFACSLFLGFLLVLMDNLWFCAGCHLVLNLFILGADGSTLGGGLQFVDASGVPLFDPTLYIFLFFILVFVIAYLRTARISRTRTDQARGPAAAG